MPWKRDSDDWTDKPYGNPRRAAKIRWESKPKTAMRKTHEGVGSLLGLLAWPFRAVAGLLGGLIGRSRRGR